MEKIINSANCHTKKLQIINYTYDLPEERIAKFPLNNREQSKLLIYRNGNIEEDRFASLPLQIEQGSLLVFNNTRVIQARLVFQKQTGANIEIFCLEPLAPSDYALAFQKTGSSSWKCMVGNLRRWKTGVLKTQFSYKGKDCCLTAERVRDTERAQEILFTWDPSELSFSEILELAGKIPIPPYLKRNAEVNDLDRYQTVYSKNEGSVAAPTAGLHFTASMLKEFTSRGAHCEELTLHIGAGTFKPVQAEYIGEHEMHTEHIHVSADALERICRKGREIIAVGTTSMRTLESLYWMGVKVLKGYINPCFLEQWEAYELPGDYPFEKAFNAILAYMKQKEITFFNATTQLIIAPGYKFKVAKGLITNFHQPKSTLLLLIATFVGEDWKKIYEYALNHNFRFLSYGDGSLLIPYSD